MIYASPENLRVVTVIPDASGVGVAAAAIVAWSYVKSVRKTKVVSGPKNVYILKIPCPPVVVAAVTAADGFTSRLPPRRGGSRPAAMHFTRKPEGSTLH